MPTHRPWEQPEEQTDDATYTLIKAMQAGRDRDCVFAADLVLAGLDRWRVAIEELRAEYAERVARKKVA